jgi:hypothetical protein
LNETTDAGTTWSTKTIINNLSGTIAFLNKNTGFTVGGDIIGNTSTILRTNDAGASWSVESSNSNRQFGASFPSSKTAYTCGLNGTILKATTMISSIFEPADADQLVVYPNPTNGKFNIAYSHSAFQKPMRVTIYNATGDLVYDQSWISEVDVSELPKGIYYIKLYDDKQTYSKSIIVE